jgi:hypothetical protein
VRESEIERFRFSFISDFSACEAALRLTITELVLKFSTNEFGDQYVTYCYNTNDLCVLQNTGCLPNTADYCSHLGSRVKKA